MTPNITKFTLSSPIPDANSITANELLAFVAKHVADGHGDDVLTLEFPVDCHYEGKLVAHVVFNLPINKLFT